MTWKSTVVYWLLAAIFGLLYLAVEKRPEPRTEMQLARERVLKIFSDDVAAVTLRRDGREIRCEVKDKRWHVVKPEDVNVPPDLIAALVENLTDKQEAEEINVQPTPDDLAAFGLSDSAPVVELQTKDGSKITITLGRRNPPQTAIYARASIGPRVLLIGVNVEYYADLLYEAAALKTTAAKTTAASKPAPAPKKN